MCRSGPAHAQPRAHARPEIKATHMRAHPNSAALMSPVKMVATVLEYFFRMVSAYLKKNEARMPCAALFTTSSMVTCARTCALSDAAAHSRTL